jgi:hypothetical protein
MPEVKERTTKRTPLQQALAVHLGPGKEDLIPVCTTAINIGQMGANGEYHLFGRVLQMPNGRDLSVENVITLYHLNSFIEWGGGSL